MKHRGGRFPVKGSIPTQESVLFRPVHIAEDILAAVQVDREELETVNILIVKLSAIGDVIHTLPSLAALRRCYPDADITWVVEEAAADLLSGHPDLDRVLVLRRKPG